MSRNIDSHSNFILYIPILLNQKIEADKIKATCLHGVEFPAVIESENIIGIQFHPEKRQINGLATLEKFSVFKNYEV